MSQTRRGFSLIELLVVIVIVGILAVVMGNWFGASQPAAVKGTVNTLHGVLAEARTVAQTTGRTVTLTTSGTQGNMMLTFPSQGDVVPTPANQALTTWIRSAAGAEATQYSGIDTDGATIPVPASSPAIEALYTGGVAPGASGRLFTGSVNTAMSFDATGRANRDFFVLVGGMRGGGSYPSAPVGLVLVTRANGIHSFYRPNPTTPWQRL